MKRQRLGLILVAVLFASFMLGYAVAYIVQNQNWWSGYRKPVIQISAEPRVEEDTPVIFEKEYTRSAKVLLVECPFKEDLLGKNLAEIRVKYSSANGFTAFWENRTLTIHQKVEDWCPEDKGKLRLKEYREWLAVFRGPDSEHDNLLRVITSIRLSTLPEPTQQAIREGRFEFKNEQELNDALENMDEYCDARDV